MEIFERKQTNTNALRNFVLEQISITDFEYYSYTVALQYGVNIQRFVPILRANYNQHTK